MSEDSAEHLEGQLDQAINRSGIIEEIMLDKRFSGDDTTTTDEDADEPSIQQLTPHPPSIQNQEQSGIPQKDWVQFSL